MNIITALAIVIGALAAVATYLCLGTPLDCRRQHRRRRSDDLGHRRHLGGDSGTRRASAVAFNHTGRGLWLRLDGGVLSAHGRGACVSGSGHQGRGDRGGVTDHRQRLRLCFGETRRHAGKDLTQTDPPFIRMAGHDFQHHTATKTLAAPALAPLDSDTFLVSGKLDAWIAFPKKAICDTFMVYRQNDLEIRKAIVVHLAEQKD